MGVLLADGMQLVDESAEVGMFCLARQARSHLNKFPRVKLLHAIVRGSSILVMTMLIRQHVPTKGQHSTMNVFLQQHTAFAVQLALAHLAFQRWDLSFFCAGVEDGNEPSPGVRPDWGYDGTCFFFFGILGLKEAFAAPLG